MSKVTFHELPVGPNDQYVFNHFVGVAGHHIGRAITFKDGTVRLFHYALIDGKVEPICSDYASRDALRNALS